MRGGLFFLSGILLLTGCTRSADPLDWKIEADDISELQAWFDQNLPLMPDDRARPPDARAARSSHALTASGTREKCIAAGMDEYLTKPVYLPALKSAIEAVLPQFHVSQSIPPFPVRTAAQAPEAAA